MKLGNVHHSCRNVTGATGAYAADIVEAFGGNLLFAQSKTDEYQEGTLPVRFAAGPYLSSRTSFWAEPEGRCFPSLQSVTRVPDSWAASGSSSRSRRAAISCFTSHLR